MLYGIRIKGLDEETVNVILEFMESKLTNKKYIQHLSSHGQECNMDWMENGMDISDSIMLSGLFWTFGEYVGSVTKVYKLSMGGKDFMTYKHRFKWSNNYILLTY